MWKKLPQTNPNRNSAKMLVLPPRELTLSTTITIDTSTKIDGEVYDASDIFGITRRNAAAGIQGSLQLFPDITINQLQVSDNYDFTRECNNRVNNGINNVRPGLVLELKLYNWISCPIITL